MTLRDQFENQGNWLFRHRDFFPVLILPLLVISLSETNQILNNFGATASLFYHIFCFLVSIVGLAVRVLVIGYAPVGTSGRNTDQQIAEQINTKGMYSIVRHPLYLGNYLIFLGFTLYTQSVWFNLFSMLAFWIYYERIMFAEEEFLGKHYGDTYKNWANKVPAFFPSLSKWKKPDLQFSLRNVLKREYSAFLEITAIFPILDILSGLIINGQFSLNYFWFSVLCLGLITYFTLRTLKRKSNILHVEGR